MRTIALKVCALAIALAVLTFVVLQSAKSSGPETDTTIRGEPSATPIASSSAGARGEDDEKGIMGPATKADPHSVRRAVKSLDGKP